MALLEGLYRALPVDQLGEKIAERASNIWWTVYILDQQFSSLMGAPVSVHEEDITAVVYNRRHSTQRAAALRLNVKISRVISQVSNSEWLAQVTCWR
jgi:proline utilization trans-activator